MPKANNDLLMIGAGGRLDIPDDAVPINGATATLVTSSTPVAVIAATAGQTIYLKSACFSNGGADAAVIVLQSITGNTVVHREPVGAGAHKSVTFNPPIAIDAGDGIEALSESTGDTNVTCSGWTG